MIRGLHQVFPFWLLQPTKSSIKVTYKVPSPIFPSPIFPFWHSWLLQPTTSFFQLKPSWVPQVGWSKPASCNPSAAQCKNWQKYKRPEKLAQMKFTGCIRAPAQGWHSCSEGEAEKGLRIHSAPKDYQKEKRSHTFANSTDHKIIKSARECFSVPSIQASKLKYQCPQTLSQCQGN